MCDAKHHGAFRRRSAVGPPGQRCRAFPGEGPTQSVLQGTCVLFRLCVNYNSIKRCMACRCMEARWLSLSRRTHPPPAGVSLGWLVGSSASRPGLRVRCSRMPAHSFDSKFLLLLRLAVDINFVGDLFSAPSCAIDSACVPESAPLRRSVVRISQPLIGGFCTGTLIRGPGRRVFVLTARHCISRKLFRAAYPWSTYAINYDYHLPCNATSVADVTATYAGILTVRAPAARLADPLQRHAARPSSPRPHPSPLQTHACAGPRHPVPGRGQRHRGARGAPGHPSRVGRAAGRCGGLGPQASAGPAGRGGRVPCMVPAAARPTRAARHPCAHAWHPAHCDARLPRPSPWPLQAGIARRWSPISWPRRCPTPWATPKSISWESESADPA